MSDKPKTEEFAKRLRLLRNRQGLSVSDVARALGISVSTYREWEYGSQIKGEPYLRLASIFKVPLTFLFLGEDGQKSQILDELNEIEKRVQSIRLKL